MKNGKKAKPVLEAEAGGAHASSPGFTLVEVVAAILILMLFLVPMLSAVSRALQVVRSAKFRDTAIELAQNKMAEIEMLPLPQEEGVEKGDFGRDYPGYRWEMEAVKTPEIMLMETYIVGMKGMEIHLTVFWNEDGVEKSITLSTLLLE